MLCCSTSLTPQSAVQEADAGIPVRVLLPEAGIFLNSDPSPDEAADPLATGSCNTLTEYRPLR